jgi:1-phosphofructokinase
MGRRPDVPGFPACAATEGAARLRAARPGVECAVDLARRGQAGRPPDGVEARFVETGRPLRTSTTIIDPERRTETHVREEGARVGPDDVRRLAEAVATLSCEGVRVVFSGSLPPGLGARAFARVLALAARRGAEVAVDTSGRGLEALRLVPKAARPSLVKPNRVELRELSGVRAATTAEAARAARSLVPSVAGAVLATLGAEGAISYDGSETLRGTCEPEDVTGAVGAGDAALAGWLWAETRGEDAAGRLRAAVAAGAAALAGSATRRFDAGLFRRLLERARVSAL